MPARWINAHEQVLGELAARRKHGPDLGDSGHELAREQVGRTPAANLCGPKTSSTSCEQAIFVDQSTDASLSRRAGDIAESISLCDRRQVPVQVRPRCEVPRRYAWL
jgi:hypothetical protein